MMRKIFGGAMAFSMVGAVVLGGVLAWTNSGTYRDSASVGTLQFDVHHDHLNDRIGPDDGLPRRVDGIRVENTGGAGAFDLIFDSGKVFITDVSSPANAGVSDQANCGVQNFVGSIVDETGGAAMLATSITPGDTVGRASLWISVNTGAPNACQGDIVNYRAQIFVRTKSSN